MAKKNTLIYAQEDIRVAGKGGAESTIKSGEVVLEISEEFTLDAVAHLASLGKLGTDKPKAAKKPDEAAEASKG